MSKISELKEIVLEYIAENVDLSNKKEVARFDEVLRQLGQLELSSTWWELNFGERTFPSSSSQSGSPLTPLFGIFAHFIPESGEYLIS